MKSTSNSNKELFLDIVEQHNILRTNPKAYIAVLEKQIKYFKGDVLNRPGASVGIQTSEGKSAYLECIEFLKKQKPMGELIFDEELSRAAQDHADDLGSTGSCDHTGSDGSSSDQRISRYVEWDVTICENIDFGATTGEDIIISLIVDDGVPQRGHRTNMFNPKLKYIGIGIADHSEFEVCTVMDYCGGITSYKNSKGKSTSKNTGNTSTSKPISTLSTKPITSSNSKPTSNDRNYSVKNLDEETDKVKALKDLINNRDRSKTEMKDVTKDFNSKVKISNNNNNKNYDNSNLLKNDPDAPSNAISVSVKVTTKKTMSKTVKTTIKTYTCDDGSTETLEITETEG